MTRRLLILCTGNYYRSRFAEELFNVEARRRGLDWVADSRGIATEFGVDNVGPISVYALEGLRVRGIALASPIRFPLQVQARDVARAHLIVALHEPEHRPMLLDRYPAWEARVTYWHVADLGFTAPAEALAAIERELGRLIDRLAGCPVRP